MNILLAFYSKKTSASVGIFISLLLSMVNISPGYASDQSRSNEYNVSNAAKQVYRLLVETSNRSILGGTSFHVSGKRIIATNYHVIENGVVFHVGYIGKDGQVRTMLANLLASFPQKDLALLETLDDLPGQALPLEGAYPALAKELFAIGFPAAADLQTENTPTSFGDTIFFTPSVLNGYVSRVLNNRRHRSQLQHQTPIVQGYSGGPLIDTDGAVLGISSSIHKEAAGISYAVLAADLIDLLSACSLPASVRSPSPHHQSSAVAAAQQLLPDLKTYPSQEKQLSLEVSDELVARGYAMLESGDVVSARLMFNYLKSHQSLAEIYIGLAKTYDPEYLQKKGIIGIEGDQTKAKQLYSLAVNLIRKERKVSLAQQAAPKRSGTCNRSLCELIDASSGPFVTCRQAN
jgi:S1-C subfamily serine protease